MRPSRPSVGRLLRASLLGAVVVSPQWAAAQVELVSPDQERFRVDGFVETQFRTLSDDFDPNRFYVSQSALVLDLEPELDIELDGWGPFDAISAFARIEARYDCVFHGCGSFGAPRAFGNSAKEAPARNWADGPTIRSVGGLDLTDYGIRIERVHGSHLDLLPIDANPGFAPFYAVGIDPETVAAAFGPRGADRFAWKSIGGPQSDLAVPLGPWEFDPSIRSNGALRNETSTTLPLPLRPGTETLYTPSSALRSQLGDFDPFDQNFDENELAWNRGASQDEWELEEAFLDLELLDSRLWIRAGKQNIVWGKTELFRTTDQFNPIDIGLASLPTLEESRIGLWSIRGVQSFHDVGPFQDVRFEFAFNFDDFEPVDTGRCGEPYTIWLICLKTTGLWAHGTSAVGLAGETKPPDPWNDSRGIEIGGRIEFRWNRFSFAITDFYGYDDIPTVALFNEYERKVDPSTGRPLDALGRPLTPANALAFATGNRQGFDLGCKASLGFGQASLDLLFGGFGGTVPDVSDRCLGDVVNFMEPITIGPLSGTVPMAIANLLAGSGTGQLIAVGALAALGLPPPTSPPLTLLNLDINDGPVGGGTLGGQLSLRLTDEQEALLGCGSFYFTDCDVDGIDFFNSEGSVVLQSFPGFEENPVATRFVNGRLVTLPGARGCGPDLVCGNLDDDPGYDPTIDGTPPPGFESEMAALSSNVATTLAILGMAEGDTGCDLSDLASCAGVRALIALSGSQRPEARAGGNGRYGRRDWTWHGGGEAAISYAKRNVLGLSADFAEDRFLTNWAFEFTWVDDAIFASNTSRDLSQEADVLNLTVSVDRPTFVNFLNPNRTFFFNSQFFLRYIPDHDSSFDLDGPISVLGTFTVATGYFQDRLLPAMTFVHDFPSASGGILWQASYRFTEAFSATVGMLAFYGDPDENRLPRHPIALPDTTTSFEASTRYGGLSAIAERDEIFFKLRYTF